MNTYPKSKNRLRGYISELEVICYFGERGFSLVSQRFRSPFAEVDLVLENNNSYLLVEVKSVSDESFLMHKISNKQKKRLKNAYIFFSQRSEKNVQIVLALVDRKGQIRVFDDFLD